MTQVDVKEFSPEGSDDRARRLRRLKECVAANRYDVSCLDIAQGMILEAMADSSDDDPEENAFLNQR